MKIKKILPFILLVFLSISCEKEDSEIETNSQKAVFMYLPWSINLTSYFYNNISDMGEAIQEKGLENERIIVFLSTSPLESEMFEIASNNGPCERTILKEYVNPSSTTGAGLTEILGDMKTFAPAESYSTIIGCHGMGWLPVVRSRSKAKEDFVYHWDFENIPMTCFFGGLIAEYQINISTLAQSLSNNGLSMKYILFDDCYMSSPEAAYELRHAANYMIACSTEVVVFSMPYFTIGKYLLPEEPDCKAIRESFYQSYSNYQYSYGALVVTDCSYLDELVELMKHIHSNYSFDSTQAANIQRVDGYSPVIFYDFGDYVQTLCGTDTGIYNNFKTLLEKVILYKTHTKEFHMAPRGPITVERYSGVTTSEPSIDSKMVDCPKISWRIDTH